MVAVTLDLAALTLPLISLAAMFTGARPLAAWRLGIRDCRKHASPNSGFGEAAVAGALGIQLGGALFRHGSRVELPTMGEPVEMLRAGHIRRAVLLMLVTSLLAGILFVLLRWLAGGMR